MKPMTTTGLKTDRLGITSRIGSKLFSDRPVRKFLEEHIRPSETTGFHPGFSDLMIAKYIRLKNTVRSHHLDIRNLGIWAKE